MIIFKSYCPHDSRAIAKAAVVFHEIKSLLKGKSPVRYRTLSTTG